MGLQETKPYVKGIPGTSQVETGPSGQSRDSLKPHHMGNAYHTCLKVSPSCDSNLNRVNTLQRQQNMVLVDAPKVEVPPRLISHCVKS